MDVMMKVMVWLTCFEFIIVSKWFETRSMNRLAKCDGRTGIGESGTYIIKTFL